MRQNILPNPRLKTAKKRTKNFLPQTKKLYAPSPGIEMWMKTYEIAYPAVLPQLGFKIALGSPNLTHLLNVRWSEFKVPTVGNPSQGGG